MYWRTIMSLEENLFELIGSGQFEKASLFLQANSKLDINALNKSGCSYLIMTARRTNKTQACHQFTETLLTHPNFIHHNTLSNTKNTPISEAISRYDASLIKVLLKHQPSKSLDAIYDKGQLLFERVVKKINELEAIIEKDEIDEKMLENQKDILNLLRTPTIRHALAQDDLSMLKKLAELDANLHKPLADGIEPIKLYTPKTNPKSYSWLSQHVQEKNESCPEYRINKLREEREVLEKERAQKEQEIMNVHIQKRNERIGQFFGLKTPDQSPKTPESKKPTTEKPSGLSNSLFKMQEVQKQMDQLTKEHHEKKTKMFSDEIDRKTQFLNNAMDLLKK